ncbi:DUF4360 domain-containing protein [Actinomycetes bacterium KLBMP 9797]
MLIGGTAHRATRRGGPICALAIAVLTSLAVAPAPAAATPPAGPVAIEDVQVHGANCRPGTVAVIVSPDKAAFTVLYSEYVAIAGGGATPSAAHQRCKLSLQVRVPATVTYAITKVDHRGFAELADGATGRQRASYQFQGDPPGAPVDHPFAGPLSDFWQVTDHASAPVYAPCGKIRKINIDTELIVSAGTSAATATSMLGMDATDGSVTSTYHFTWKPC